jgi:hypothetical protein
MERDDNSVQLFPCPSDDLSRSRFLLGRCRRGNEPGPPVSSLGLGMHGPGRDTITLDS